MNKCSLIALGEVAAGGRKWAAMNIGATSRSGRDSFEDYGGYLLSSGSPRNPDSACILSFKYCFDGHGFSRELCGRTEDLHLLGHCVRAVAQLLLLWNS